MSRWLMLALAAGVAGLIIGRTLPPGTPSRAPDSAATSAAPTAAPLDCNAERTQIASMQAQLGICVAFQVRDSEPEPAASVTAAPEPPPTATVHPEYARALALRAGQPQRLVEEVIVRHEDGTTRGYPADDWPEDRDDGQVIARTIPGRFWYYRLDGSPVGLRDLVGSDGVLRAGGRTYRLPTRDAGAP